MKMSRGCQDAPWLATGSFTLKAEQKVEIRLSNTVSNPGKLYRQLPISVKAFFPCRSEKPEGLTIPEKGVTLEQYGADVWNSDDKGCRRKEGPEQYRILDGLEAEG